MYKWLWLACACVLGMMVGQANAGDVSEVNACVKYQRSDFSWSQGYAVKGLIVKGRDLAAYAREKGYYENYGDSQYYLVVFWKEGGYSALELGYTSSLSSYYSRTNDQHGKRWEAKERYGSSCD